MRVPGTRQEHKMLGSTHRLVDMLGLKLNMEADYTEIGSKKRQERLNMANVWGKARPHLRMTASSTYQRLWCPPCGPRSEGSWNDG